MFLIISLSILFFAIAYILLTDESNNKAIFGVYRQGGRWFYFKYAAFLSLLYLRKLKKGFKTKNVNIEEMDKLQKLSDHSKAIDAVFFIGANKDGFYFTMGTERRPMGVIGGLFYLVLPGNEILCSPKIPDTILFGGETDAYGAEGIHITPIKSMEKWKIQYRGKMSYKLSNRSDLVDVQFSGIFTSDKLFFNYDTDLSLRTIARSIAREDWSREYFETLKSAHQSHYEQFGEMTVDLQIDNKIIDNIKFDSFRDHSYGYKRDWSLMHRYAFHHIFLKDGRKISIGVVSQPCTASLIEMGTICFPQNKKNEYSPIEWCDLELYKFGENGTAPTDYAFQFGAAGEVYTVQINVECLSEHFVGSDWEARMVERFIKCTVNGVLGWGVSEFHYNNRSGRSEKYTKNDPSWFTMMRH